jgi:putative FmdB family regulatory protein
MPIYEYRCSKCNALFEYLAKNSRDKAATCSKCGAAGPVKQLSNFSARVSDGHAHGADACGSEACGGCAGSDSCPYE